MTIDGLNLAKIIYDLHGQGIELQEIVFLSQKTLSFCCYVKDIEKVVAYLEKKCYTIRIIEDIGITKVLTFFKRKAIGLAIVAIFLILVKVLGCTCQQIVVVAPSEIESIVAQAVESAGASVGVRKSKISLDSVENAVCVALPLVKYAFASFDGSRLTVVVEMRAVADEPVDDTQPRDIIASCDGVVERILTLNGTPLVSVGDEIKKGQVLIKGENVFADGSTESATAQGEVWATVMVKESVLFCPTVVEFLPTGSVLKRWRIRLGNYVSDFSKEIEYDSFCVQSEVKRLYPLGIEIEYETVYETTPIQKQQLLEEQLPSLQLKAFEKLKQTVGDAQLTKVEYFTENIFEDLYVVALTKLTQNVAIGG